MIALDTNLLVYSSLSGMPQHVAARKAIQDAVDRSEGCGISLPSIAEFWSVVTHPQSAGGPARAEEVEKYFDALLGNQFLQIWMPKAGFGKRLIQAAVEHSAKGRHIYDLQMALIALEHGATELWTHDRDFLKVRGLRLFDPLA